MKTAISVPDDLFTSAEVLAKRLGTSRSKLYVRALASYVRRHTGDQVTQTLNDVYSSAASTVDGTLDAMQARSLPKERW